jgi:uncharacterized SAM-binding protein YcdF (DUF218 family)
LAPQIGCSDSIYFYGYQWGLGRSKVNKREVHWAAASGLGGSLYSSGGRETQLGKKLLVRLGVEPQRIIIEDRSQNTAENANLSKIFARLGSALFFRLSTS